MRSIPFGRPLISDADRQAVAEVLAGPILTHGPRCTAFESSFTRFMGGGHAVTVSSGMAALHLSYLHLGVGPGDEVLVPAQTHNATVGAVEWTGARPVFVDCDPRSGNVDAEGLARKVTDRTKAIGLVHFLGVPCEMEPILALARNHSLSVVEDCALAIGSRYDDTHVGLLGDAGCYSFYPAKQMTSGEGGMFVTRHEIVARHVQRLRAFGVDRTHNDRKIPGKYDVDILGLNYRMSELQAALGHSQMGRMEEFLTARKTNFERLSALLSDISDTYILGPTSERQQSSWYCLSIILDENTARGRDEILLDLKGRGVGTSVYYPHPTPRLRYYADKYGYDPAHYPGAASISDRCISLPVGPHLADGDVDYIAEQVQEAVAARRL